MSFFKDFKDDFSQAVNELMSTEELPEENDSDMLVNTLEQEVDAKTELDKLEGLLEKVDIPDSADPVNKAPLEEPKKSVESSAKASHAEVKKPISEMQKKTSEEKDKKEKKASEEKDKKEKKASEEEPRKMAEVPGRPAIEKLPKVSREEERPQSSRTPDTAEKKAPASTTEESRESFQGINKTITEHVKEKKEDIIMNTEEVKEVAMETPVIEEEVTAMPKEVSDEVTVITEGTAINGNMQSVGSIEVRGKVTGNVECNGKLTVTGVVKGNSNASEFFADAAKIEGEISTDGTVKIGLGSIVIGNITAASAVIAGAIKGDIDVQGPVVVDTSAVVMGNIKSRSVQINNGAVIEGFCSQCYAEVDVNKLFE